MADAQTKRIAVTPAEEKVLLDYRQRTAGDRAYNNGINDSIRQISKWWVGFSGPNSENTVREADVTNLMNDISGLRRDV